MKINDNYYWYVQNYSLFVENCVSLNELAGTSGTESIVLSNSENVLATTSEENSAHDLTPFVTTPSRETIGFETVVTPKANSNNQKGNQILLSTKIY